MMKKIFQFIPLWRGKKNKNSRGFTLVETLVAISIFTVSILALMSVLAQGVSSTNYAKQKMIASYLAQEGVEYIRNMRDTYVLYSADAPTGWAAFNSKLTNASCDSANGCYFGSATNPMTGLSLNACSSTCPSSVLFYDAATGKYGASGVNSGFSRKIKVTQTSNETKVLSTVSWTQGSGNYSIVLSESVFNWVE